MTYDGSCIICLGENPITKKNPMTDEHIIPEFIGGGLIVKNVCKICNGRMGHSFEGRLSKSLLFSLPRYSNSIRGKSETIPNPFSGTYNDENDSSLKYRILNDQSVEIIPNIEIYEANGNTSFKVLFDADRMDKFEVDLKKKISRYFQFKGEDAFDSKVDNMASAIINNVQKFNFNTIRLEFKQSVTINFDDYSLLAVKIAYEMSVYHFGSEYLRSRQSSLLRTTLNTAELSPEINGAGSIDDEFLKTFFNEKYHWVAFLGSACVISLFGMLWVIRVLEKSNIPIENSSVYRFCYLSGKVDKITLMELISDRKKTIQL